MPDTQRWPYIPAKYFTKVSGVRRVRLGVIHDMEFPERDTAAEDVARYFQHPDAGTKPSAHICVDDNSIVQCVWDNDVANAAPGANHDGIQIELAGYAKQTRGDWLDPYGVKLLALASDACAQYCLKYGIPPVWLSVAQVKGGVAKGWCGHRDVTAAFHKSEHQDPGPNFPWDYFLTSVANHIVARSQH